MITLYQFSPCWNMPSASPFCVKLETILKMASFSYKSSYLNGTKKAPKKKLPYAKIGDVVIADSSAITNYLIKNCNFSLNKHLNIEQTSMSHAYQSLIEEQLYWIIVYTRWIDDENWRITKKTYFSDMPWLIKSIIPNILRSKIKRSLYMQGIGRHSKDEICDIGVEIIRSISNFIGEKKYCFNEKPSTLDAIIYAFMLGIISPPINSKVKEFAIEQNNIVNFCNRITRMYYEKD